MFLRCILRMNVRRLFDLHLHSGVLMRYFNLKLIFLVMPSLFAMAGPVHATMVSAPDTTPWVSSATTGARIDATALHQFISKQRATASDFPVNPDLADHLPTGPVSDYSNVRIGMRDDGRPDPRRYEDEDVIGNCATHCEGHRHVEVSAVPLPAAAWMFLSGLMAMGAAVRRRFDITS
jgi:hypothetical protein